MKITLAAVRAASARKNPMEPLVQEYLRRMNPMMSATTVDQPSKEKLMEWQTRESVQGALSLILLDSRGQQHSSEQLAATIRRQQDAGKRHLIFAVGPPDGWDTESRALASLIVSFGPITLPHELARLVLAEQLYRACTILAGHPYHSGH